MAKTKKRSGPGRPRKKDAEKVRRVVVYIAPDSYDRLFARASELKTKVAKYAKRALEKLAASLPDPK